MIFERIQKLCVDRKTNISQLERDCGLANATIRRWEINSPSAENLRKVADHFSVSVDYLLGRKIYALSDEAIKYAKLFDALSNEKKQLALAYMGVVNAQ